VKYLIDAQLPKRMIAWLRTMGFDAKHTSELPDGNRSTDAQLLVVAETEGRIVVTKDADFVDSHLLAGRPEKLLLVSTGNIGNRELEQLVQPLLPTIEQEFNNHSFLELDRSGLFVRG
jgi:predicted nuclease of predicted toxin-antitoxin system